MLSENLNVFLSDFGQPAMLVSGSTSKSVSVIFDEEYLGMELGAEGRSITATCKTSDCTGVNHRSLFQVAAKTYKVEGVHPIMDGAFTELVLKEYSGSVPKLDSMPLPGSVASTSRSIKVAFSWGDSTPKPIYLAAAGTTIQQATIAISTPFNGLNPSLALGDAQDPRRLIAENFVNPAEAGEYQTLPWYGYQLSTQIYLLVAPGRNATQGAGFVTLEI